MVLSVNALLTWEKRTLCDDVWLNMEKRRDLTRDDIASLVTSSEITSLSTGSFTSLLPDWDGPC